MKDLQLGGYARLSQSLKHILVCSDFHPHANNIIFLKKKSLGDKKYPRILSTFLNQVSSDAARVSIRCDYADTCTYIDHLHHQPCHFSQFWQEIIFSHFKTFKCAHIIFLGTPHGRVCAMSVGFFQTRDWCLIVYFVFGKQKQMPFWRGLP